MNKKQQLKELYKEWNKKLADSGFEDIEDWDQSGIDKQKSVVLPNKYRQQLIKHERLMQQGYEDHLRACENYHLHNHDKLDRLDGILIKWVSEGYSYREILGMLKEQHPDLYFKNGKPGISLFKLSRAYIPRLTKQAYEWNKTSPDGLWNPANQDIYIDDFLIQPDKPLNRLKKTR